jgi:hypothetical protein
MLAELAVQSHSVGIMKRPGLLIDDLRAVLEANSPTSKLGRWFTANQVEFENLLTTVRPRWEVLAVKFAEEGLISVPSAFWGTTDTPERRLARKRAGEASRQVWQRVKRRPVKAGKSASHPPPLPATQGRKRAPAVSHDPPPNDDEDDEFRPARPRKR